MSLKYEKLIRKITLEEKAVMMSGKTHVRRLILKNMEFHLW